MSIRDHLQRGSLRGTVTCGAFLAACITTFIFFPHTDEQRHDFFDVLQKVSFVAVAFAVTAYNLRVRVVDFAIKAEGKSEQIEDFCRMARGCGKNLTSLVLLFVLTATVLALGAFLSEYRVAAAIYAAFAFGLLACSLVAFLYLIFAFEALERVALDNAELSSRSREAKRLFTS